MNWKQGTLLVLVVATVTGCATIPAGPNVAVLPPPGKPLELFAGEENTCRQWAYQQVGGQVPSETANRNLAIGAAIGTAIGAGIGAAVGAVTGNVAAGAAIGGATGLFGGTTMFNGPGYGSGYQLQRRYDIAYQQCMYAKGNLLPGMSPKRIAAPPPPANHGTTATAPQAVPKTSPPPVQ